MDDFEAMGFELSEEAKEQLSMLCFVSGATIEAITSLLREFSEKISDLTKAMQKLAMEIISYYDERKKAHEKWQRVPCVRLPVLLLDKRRKVHRCRNNC